MTIAGILKDWRREHRYSKKQAHHLIGVSDRTYLLWERGEWTPRPMHIPMIAEATGIPLLHLMIAAGHIDRQDVEDYKTWTDGLGELGMSL